MLRFWCKVVNTSRTRSAVPVRASISFPPVVYQALREIAKHKKVSLAWVVRDAAEKYVAGETAKRQKRSHAIAGE